MNPVKSFIDHMNTSPDTAHRPVMPLKKRWTGEAFCYGIFSVIYTIIGFFPDLIEPYRESEAVFIVIMILAVIAIIYIVSISEKYKKIKKEDEMTKEIMDKASGMAAKIVLFAAMIVFFGFSFAEKDIVLHHDNLAFAFCSVLWWHMFLKSIICLIKLRGLSAEDEEE